MVYSEESMTDPKTNNSFDPDRCGNLTEDYTLVRCFFSKRIETTFFSGKLSKHLPLSLGLCPKMGWGGQLKSFFII